MFDLRKLARATFVASLTVLAACSGGSGGTAPVTPPDGGTDPIVDPVDTSLPLWPANSTNIAYEHARPERLWVVNPDNDTVTVIDAHSKAVLGEITVPGGARTLAFSARGEAWVVSKQASVASVIDASRLTITRTVTLPRASQPYGIVFSPADGQAWIGLSATGEVISVDPASGAVGARIAVGGSPRHLAITGDGKRLLVSRYISAPLPGEDGQKPLATVDGVDHGGEVTVIDTQSRAITSRVVLAVSGGTDSAIRGRGIPNYLGAAAISPDGSQAWIPSKQDNVQRGSYRDITEFSADGLALDFQSTVRAVTSKILLGATPVEDRLLRIDHDDSSQATAATFDPSGRYVYVALETSREFSIIDVEEGRELRRIFSGTSERVSTGAVDNYAPQGLALSTDGKQLAVNNVLSRTVALYDLTQIRELAYDLTFPVPVMIHTVGNEKLPANVLRGKQLFHDGLDPRLSRDKYMSCASCHNEGGDDGRVWDLTNLGEGLRNTIALNGRRGSSLPLHWSGNFDEVQDFEGQIRELAGGTGLMSDADLAVGSRSQALGDPKAGISADLDALAAYVQSLSRHQPSPWRNEDHSLTESAVAGKALFVTRGCTSCHFGAQFAGDGSQLFDVGTLGPGARPWADVPGKGVLPLTGIDVPTLRDVWATPPYLHDGSAATIEDAVRRHTEVIDSAELARIADYVRQIGSQEPEITP